MSSLKIGLVTSSGEESDLLVKLLTEKNADITYQIAPQNISSEHIENDQLSVWLLNIDDDSWHDKVDDLLDESSVPVYFNEPGSLDKQTHPEHWCDNLVDRLYEVSDVEPPAPAASLQPTEENLPTVEEIFAEPIDSQEKQEQSQEDIEISAPEQASKVLAEDAVEETTKEAVEETKQKIVEEETVASVSDEDAPLANSLNELEMTTESLSNEMASELVGELELIPQVLKEKDSSNANQQKRQTPELSLDYLDNNLDIEEDETLQALDNLSLSSLEQDDVGEDAEDNEIETSESESLTLEPLEKDKKITGKANFLDESFSSAEEEENILIEEAEDSQLENSETLTLELTEEEKRKTGKANFLDESFSSTEQEENILIQDTPTYQLEEETDLELSLQEEQTDWLDGHTKQQTETNESLTLASEEDDESATEAEFILPEEEQAEEELSTVEQQTTTETAIPLLDEAASGIDFEENLPEPETGKAPCWVIGASLGGPAAVKRFMQCIPKDIHASFIVAQHIDESFLEVLAEILTTNSHFQVKIASGSQEMSPGTVVIAPLKGKTVFFKDGSILVDHSQKWTQPYSPCINDVLDSVSQAYGDLAGAIIFSGMGEDGLQGAKKMRERGGIVWAQTVETCANSSMPEAIINNHQADFIGSPEELAEKLVAHLSR